MDKSLIAFGNFSEESGYEAMKTLLRLSNPPTAVFTTNDMMAIGAIKAIEEKGKSVPNDVAIVGGDDIRLGRYVRPALTDDDEIQISSGRHPVGLLPRVGFRTSGWQAVEKRARTRLEPTVLPIGKANSTWPVQLKVFSCAFQL